MTNDWELDHLGIVVRDINTAIKHYQLIGMELSAPPAMKVFGAETYLTENQKPNNDMLEFKACYVQNETFRIELIQPVRDGDLFHEHLERYGEGAIIFGFHVSEIRRESDRLVKLGIPAIADINPNSNTLEILFDTRKFGNMMMSLSSGPVPAPTTKSSEDKWSFNHLGLVVKNVDKLAEYYQPLGFKLLSPPREIVFKKVEGWAIYGKMPAVPQKTKACQFQNRRGTFLLEVNEPGEDGSLHREFLENHGEGVNHIHFLTDDLEKELEKMVSKGFPAIMTARRPNGILHESFYETREVGNVCIALWSGPPPFRPKPE